MSIDEVPEDDVRSLAVKPKATKFVKGNFDIQYG